MSKKLVASGALVAGVGLAASSFGLVAVPAFAATDCGTGTEVATGVCEVSYNSAGSYTLTLPSGVGKIGAVLVGAGGGSFTNPGDGSYGGGGGEVVYVDSLSKTGELTIEVGAGGAAASNDNGTGAGETGGDSTVGSFSAAGGYGGYFDDGGIGGGDSGNDNLGSLGTGNAAFNGAGGGAGGDAPECTPDDNDLTTYTCLPGMGLTASEVANDAILFPALLGEPEYGIGGDGISVGIASVGDYDAGHGGDAVSVAGGDDGNDGGVIIRWSYGLPDTGMSVQPWMLGAGLAAVAAGALFMSGALRTRRQGRHSS